MAAGKWDSNYDAVIALAQETMGWEGATSRNPVLARIFLQLISAAIGGCQISKNDSGMFTIYLSWALQRLGENKFKKPATDLLLNTCHQYSGKVVFSQIEKL
eukprot:1085504_1